MTEISSFALINEFFLRGATERNTRSTEEVIFARVCKVLQNPLRHSFSLTCFERLRRAVRVKKRHVFLANLKRILKHSLRVREIFLVQKFIGEMLKTSN